MHPRTLSWITCAATLLFSAQFAQGVMIGINFSAGQGNAANVAPLTISDITGVVPQDHWNNAGGDGTTGNGGNLQIFSPNPGVIVDSTGAITSVAVSWTSTNSWSINNAGRTPAIAQLLNGYLDNTNALTPTTVTITGIPFALYNVIVYVGSDANNRSGHVTVGGNPIYYLTNSNNNPPTFVEATSTTLAGAAFGTYVEYENLSSSSVVVMNTRDNNNVGLHAIQIVEVPEPATGVLLVCAGVAAALRRRRDR